MNLKKLLLHGVLATGLSAAASADYTLTFQNTTDGFVAAGFGSSTNTTVAWSANHGGSLKLTNNRGATADPNYGWIAKLYLNGSQLSPAKEVYEELLRTLTYGGTISYDVIVDTGSVTGPDPTFAGVSLFADNQNGSFDTEDNQPLLSAFPIGSTVVQNVVIPVQEAGAKANNDGLAYLLDSTGALQLGLGTNYDNATGFTCYIDNFKISPNVSKNTLFDFETGLQGWALVSGAMNATVTPGSNIPEAPNKVMSLNRTVDASFKWVAQISQNTAGQPLFDALTAEAASPVPGAVLTFDVIYQNSTITGGSFANLSVAINDDGGWTQINGLGLYGSADFGKNLIKKVSIPLADLGIDAGATFYEMQIALNGDWTGSATISIDNIAIEGPPAAPTTVLVNLTFDTAADVLPWSYDFGDASNMSTVSWSSTENSGNPGSGSLKLKFHYPNDGVAFTGDVFADPGIDLSNATIVSFDVKVDPASATDAFGNNGYLQFVFRNTGNFDWEEQSGLAGNVNDADGWMRVSAPLNGTVDAVRAITLQLYGGTGQNLPGDVTLYIDNIVVKEPATQGDIVTNIYDFQSGIQGWGTYATATDLNASASWGNDIPNTGNNVLCLERGTDGFSWVAEVFENTAGQPLYDTLVAASPDARIEFEVYYRGADFPSGSFANVSVALDDGTWSQVDNQAEYVAPAYGTDTVKTVSIPLSALGWSAGATYYKLVLGVNGDWGTSEFANVYVDDIRLVTPASEMQVPLVVTSVSKSGDDLTVTFTGKPDNAANWIVKGSTDLLGFPDDMTSSSTITEPAAGSYQAVIDVTGKGPKYFVRIQD